MKKIDVSEKNIHSDLVKTENGIKELKKKRKSNGFLGMVLGGFQKLVFITLGGLVLITLARVALKKWTDAYMPKPDGSQLTIFGIPIPGWSTIKAIGIGIWNWITVGLPNWWDRLKLFVGKIKNALFGRNGAFRNAE